jgi:tetratricopeptide (TPR) repeat protein
VSTDRESSLRRAEKLLRQGRLDGAIQEYERLVEEQPQDWNTRNLLGDLYVRAGQVEQAAAHFTWIADHFAREGFFPRAIALYKKVIKFKPDDEHALLKSAEIAASQGLLMDAKAAFSAVAGQRRARGDAAGAADVLIRIAALDPSDTQAVLSAARAAQDSGRSGEAAAHYKSAAAELLQRESVAEGMEALKQALLLDPADAPARDMLLRECLLRGDIDVAREYASTDGHLRAIADELSSRGREEEALDTLAEIVERSPSDAETRVRLARSLIGRGEIERAAGLLSSENLGGHTELMLLASEARLRLGRIEEGRELLATTARDHAASRVEVVALAWRLLESDAAAAFACVEVVSDVAVAARDWAAAAQVLQEFASRVPSCVPGLMKLVDVCVDGDLQTELVAAQVALADAYLETGKALEARIIAEDLVMRGTADDIGIERLRRALQMLGEPDPETVIAECVANASFRDTVSLDAIAGDAVLSDGAHPAVPLSAEHAAGPREAGPEQGEPAGKQQPTGRTPAVAPAFAHPPAAAGTAKLQPPTARSSSVPGLSPAGPDPRASGGKQAATGHGQPEPPGQEECWEVDLSAALSDLRPGNGPSRQADADPARTRDLDAVFEDFRSEVQREQVANTAAQHFRLAMMYRDMGMVEEAMKALESAVRSPRYRFQSASLLGRMCLDRGRLEEAIDWFERAAEAPATSAEAGRALLYELGQALESAGEEVRALAVYLELQADAGEYRDITARIKRLSCR